MKILYIVDSLKVGGAEILLLEMIRGFKQRDLEIIIAYYTDGPLRRDFDALNVAVHQLSRHGLRDPFCHVRLMRLIGREKPDVVHTHLRKSDLSGQLSAALMRVPVRVSSAHNIDPWRQRKILTYIERVVTAGCQKIIAVSSEVREYLIQVAGYQPERVVTIANGIDLEKFNPALVQPLDRQERWGFESHHRLIGIIGRLDVQKDHTNFLEAAKIVCLESAAARFLIVGDGPRRQELEALAHSMGLSGKVVFAGLIREMPALLATLDAVAFSSRWEGLPVALLEAMAMSRPIVSTGVGGIPELIKTGESGILVDPGDSSALAKGMLRLVNDEEYASKVASKCRPLIEEHYCVNTMHNKILDIYHDLSNSST